MGLGFLFGALVDGSFYLVTSGKLHAKAATHCVARTMLCPLMDVRLILDIPTSTPSPFLTKAPSCCHNSQTIKNKTSLDV